MNKQIRKNYEAENTVDPLDVHPVPMVIVTLLIALPVGACIALVAVLFGG